MVVLSPKNEGQVGSHGTPYFSQKKGVQVWDQQIFSPLNHPTFDGGGSRQ